MLADNPKLGGQIPSECKGPSQLSLLDLSSCDLHGPLPQTLPRDLADLNLARNSLTGETVRGSVKGAASQPAAAVQNSRLR